LTVFLANIKKYTNHILYIILKDYLSGVKWYILPRKCRNQRQ